MFTDNCPISTKGLRALRALIEQHDVDRPVKDAQREQSLIEQRLSAAFGASIEPSSERVSSLRLVELVDA